MNEKNCPICHTSIPEHAPGGLCPACVLRGADEPEPDPSNGPTLEEVAAAFPKLEILRIIGHGGMGYVYQARQPELDRMVALKILSPALRRDPAFEERFAREARVLGKLQHPNIVTIYEHGESGGYFYLMMEFVDGVNLRQAMSAGRFSPEQALAIVPAICDALQSAHAQGVWHRDIKPENILLDRDGRVKIADFGIARILGDPERNFTLTRTGGLLGSAAYMAPEQYEKPHSVDHRADIYSLGVVIYEMLTGELPLGRFPAPSQKAKVNARIDEIVMRTLEKERELRQQSANEVKTDMCAAAMPGGSTVHARPSLGPTILSHGVLFALLATIFLFVLPGFAEILREMGVPRHSLPRIFLLQSVGGLRSVTGLLLFPLLFGIDVGLCFLVRKIGGRIGLRLWNAAFIVGMISIMSFSCLAMFLPMKTVIAQLQQEELKISDPASAEAGSVAAGAVAKDPANTAKETNQKPKANQSNTPRSEDFERVMPSVSMEEVFRKMNQAANRADETAFSWFVDATGASRSSVGMMMSFLGVIDSIRTINARKNWSEIGDKVPDGVILVGLKDSAGKIRWTLFGFRNAGEAGWKFSRLTSPLFHSKALIEFKPKNSEADAEAILRSHLSSRRLKGPYEPKLLPVAGEKGVFELVGVHPSPDGAASSANFDVDGLFQSLKPFGLEGYLKVLARAEMPELPWIAEEEAEATPSAP